MSIIATANGAAAAAVSATQFQRRIGLGSGVAFVVGIIIGSGIFISPKGVYLNAHCSPTWSLAVWSVCGLFSMLGSLVYAELGTTIVRSGGDYAYIRKGLGEVPSFLYLWLNIVVIRPASQAILALTSAYYLLGAFVDSECAPGAFELSARLVAALLISKFIFRPWQDCFYFLSAFSFFFFCFFRNSALAIIARLLWTLNIGSLAHPAQLCQCEMDSSLSERLHRPQSARALVHRGGGHQRGARLS